VAKQPLELKSVSKTKLVALAMLVIWPVGMITGYTFGGMLHGALIFSVVMWALEVTPESIKKKAYRSPRPGG
jgi:hypothetical protein